MSGRTEMSTTLQDPNPELTDPRELTSPRTATIALIGPNATHRRVMAKALIGSEARAVREFADYPANLGDIPRLMEENFDVVMIDVDSDQSYALQIVEKIAAFNTAVVMVYSMRNDPDLLRECMRAGARDFLPLPEDIVETPAAEEPEIPVALQEELEPLNPADFLLPEPQISPEARSLPEIPEPQQYSVPSRNYYVEPRHPEPEPFLQSAEPPRPAPQPQLHPEELRRPPAPSTPAEPQPPAASPSNDFSEWDKLWIHSAMPAAAKTFTIGPTAVAPTEPAPQKKSGPVAIQSGPQLVANTNARAESVAAPPAPPLFSQVESDYAAQPKRAWVRWALLAGVPLVIVGLVMLVFMPTSRQNAPAAPQTTSVAPQAESPDHGTSTASDSNAPKAKPSPAAHATSVVLDPDTAGQTAPVASDMMNAQLSAPSRISGEMKKPASAEEAPAGFAPGAMETGDAAPGILFATPKNMKVVPGLSAISAGVAEGMLIHKTAPIYPEFAKAARVSGTVVLAANITKEGAISDLHVISGPTVLRGPAADAVKTWRYRPFLLNKQPVEVQTTIKVIFSLDR